MDFLPPPVFVAQSSLNILLTLILTPLMDPSTISNYTRSSSPTLDDSSVAPREHEDISSCAVDLVNELSNLSLNLANPDVLNQVDWVQQGRSSTSILVLNHKDEGEDLYSPAILEFVGELSPGSFWLYACAGWNGDRGPSNSWSKPCPFEKARARAHVRRSTFAYYSKFWTPAFENLKKIVNLGVTCAAGTRDKAVDYNIVYGHEICI
jgi:hypothetical protein